MVALSSTRTDIRISTASRSIAHLDEINTLRNRNRNLTQTEEEKEIYNNDEQWPYPSSLVSYQSEVHVDIGDIYRNTIKKLDERTQRTGDV